MLPHFSGASHRPRYRPPVLGFLARRIARALLTAVGVVSAVFVLTSRVWPGATWKFGPRDHSDSPSTAFHSVGMVSSSVRSTCTPKLSSTVASPSVHVNGAAPPRTVMAPGRPA